MDVDKLQLQHLLAIIASTADGTASKTHFQTDEEKVHLRLLEDAGYVADDGRDMRATAAGFAVLEAAVETDQNVFDIYIAATTGTTP